MANLEDWSEQLYEAMASRKPIPPLTASDPDLTVEDAYRIQLGLVERLRGDGATIVGYKLGLTSQPMQELLGVSEPDYSPVLSSMVHSDGAGMPLEAYIQPKVEAEIALVLDRSLQGPGVTTLQASQAVAGAVPALEVVDSRIANWEITLIDTIADLASSAAIILGERLVSIEDWDPRLLGMAVTRDDSLVATGAGAAALGSPLGAVAWLANTLGPYGVVLEPGHVVMTGSLHGAFEVTSGDVVRADFDRLGSVAARFL